MKKKGPKKVAFISVQSDAVRSGEDLRLDVSKGLAKTGTKAGNNLEIVFLTMQKNHREVIALLLEISARQKFQTDVLDKMVNGSDVTDVLNGVERIVTDWVRPINAQLNNVLYHMTQPPPRQLPIWQRIWNYIFGQEK
jgi:hypothetical protein